MFPHTLTSLPSELQAPNQDDLYHPSQFKGVSVQVIDDSGIIASENDYSSDDEE